MFIEDEELRLLYRDASLEQLDKLEAGLLHLEKQPSDTAKLKELLRATHSLKGDSCMLGVADAETITHQMEDLLSAVEQGERALTPTLCDCLYQGLDSVRKIAREAVTGEPADINVFHVLAQLMNADDDGHGLNGNGFSLAATPIALESEAITPIDPPVTTKISDSEEVEGSAIYPIETVRVAAPKLDTLMTQAGELAVTKGRITRRMEDMDRVLSLWEGWSQEALVNRLACDHLQRQLDPEMLGPLRKLQQLNDSHLEQLGDLFKQMHSNAYEDAARLESISNDLESGILKLRQLPFSSLFKRFPRMVRDLAKQQGKEINLVMEGGDTQVDKRILKEMKAPLTHLLRNAIDHGIEIPNERMAAGKPPTATLCLKADQSGNRIRLEVVDDGRGLNLEAIQRTALRRGLYTEAQLAKMSVESIQDLIFAPGFSTRTTVTEISGRGVGLDVVRANVERLKGSIQVHSIPAKGCTFRFTLNTSTHQL